jgi:hypothetical protein
MTETERPEQIMSDEAKKEGRDWTAISCLSQSIPS